MKRCYTPTQAEALLELKRAGALIRSHDARRWFPPELGRVRTFSTETVYALIACGGAAVHERDKLGRPERVVPT